MTAEQIPADKQPPPRLAVVRAKAKAADIAARAATVVGSMPAPVNLLLYQGDDFYLELTLSGSGGIDLTTYVPKAEIRTTVDASSVLATFVSIIADPTTIRLHLPHAQAELLTADAVWDVQITDPAGLVTTVAYGSVTLTKQVTR